MNKTKKGISILLSGFAAFLIIAVGSYFLYCWATYIDETIIEGKAYGFNIGETKPEAFENLKTNYQNQTVYILHPLDKNDRTTQENIAPRQRLSNYYSQR